MDESCVIAERAADKYKIYRNYETNKEICVGEGCEAAAGRIPAGNAGDIDCEAVGGSVEGEGGLAGDFCDKNPSLCCARGTSWNGSKCESVSCEGNKVYNSAAGKCVCNNRCGNNGIRNEVNCSCSCRNSCPAGQKLDSSCECVSACPEGTPYYYGGKCNKCREGTQEAGGKCVCVKPGGEKETEECGEGYNGRRKREWDTSGCVKQVCEPNAESKEGCSKCAKKKCSSDGSAWGECSRGGECEAGSANCNNSCQCESGYTWNGNSCVTSCNPQLNNVYDYIFKNEADIMVVDTCDGNDRSQYICNNESKTRTCNDVYMIYLPEKDWKTERYQIMTSGLTKADLCSPIPYECTYENYISSYVLSADSSALCWEVGEYCEIVSDERINNCKCSDGTIKSCMGTVGELVSNSFEIGRAHV
jgi:hypothetical protein